MKRYRAAGAVAKMVAGGMAAYVARRRKPGAKKAPRYGLRKRTGSRTVVKRRRVRETVVPASEYSRASVSLGRKPKHNLAGAWKLLKQNISSTIYGFRFYSAFAGTQGAYVLRNLSTTLITGPLTPPLHLYEVTSAVNSVGGVVTQPQIGWQPVFSNPLDTATLSWSNIAGVNQTLTVENADGATTLANNYPAGNDTLDWLQAKLLFYAPTGRPSRIQVDVVQFTDTRLVPDAVNGISQFACAFYQSLTKKFSYSPMEPGDARYRRYIKTLYTNTFILNPKESTEVVNTIYRELNVFMRMNRKCTYDWQDSDRMNMTGNEGQQNTDTAISTQVHPRARIYLMIRGQAGNSNTESTLLMPSYDIVLRTKHSQLAQ